MPRHALQNPRRAVFSPASTGSITIEGIAIDSGYRE
jgi:hypothetical protein